jgi:hypothetical protein
VENKQIANLKLSVDHQALRSIISSGRLLEFADTVATQAAAQISAQLVQHVAEAALQPKGLESAVGAEVSYLLVVGDGEPGFGTVPRGPTWRIVQTGLNSSAMRQLAVEDSDAA